MMQATKNEQIDMECTQVYCFSAFVQASQAKLAQFLRLGLCLSIGVFKSTFLQL